MGSACRAATGTSFEREILRPRAAAVMQKAFSHNIKAIPISPFVASEARRTGGGLTTVLQYIHALNGAGLPRQRADLIAQLIISEITALWTDDLVDPLTACVDEEEKNAEENILSIRYISDPSDDNARRLYMADGEHIATKITRRASLIRHHGL